MKRLTLEIAEYEGPTKWRWRLLQEGGAFVTDHLVELDRSAAEYDGFVNLYAFVRLNATTGVATASEEALIARVAEWVRRQVWGPIGDELASAAADEPLTVLVRIPEGAEELLFRPFELPFVESNPGLDLSLVFAHERDDPPTGTESVVEDSLRMLAIFSAPTDQVALNTRYERHELRRLIARVAQAGGRAIELRILQYGVTRQQLDEVLDGGNGWDLIHFSGHGLPAGLILEKEDGSTDLVHSHEFTSLLRPTRERLKLVTLSSCESGAVAAANTMQLLGIDEGEEAERPDPALEQRVALPAIAQELSGELDCAVMAMRYPVEDEFAIGLASELYSGLLERGQSLPRALQRALREAESVHSGRLSLATPALFGVHSASLRLEPPRVAPTEFDALAPKLAYFEPEPNHFVGRIGPLARASAALAPKSDRRGVVFHGMAGAGKTACALELAYRYEDSRFEAMAWHKAPSENQDIGEALARFAVDLEIQLPGLQIAHVIDDVEQLKQFLPRLKALLRERSLLIVLDNVESLLTNDGQWRDERWHHLVEALIGHDGLSRLVLTTRVPPHDLLGREDILIEPINSLSAGESALLARQLPNLGKLLSRESDIEVERGRDLVRRTVEIVQGNPKLIELADRQATDADALEARIAEANRAWAQGTNLGAFFETGEPDRSIEAEDFLRVLHSWTDAISDTLSDELRLAFQLLCCLEERDRHWGAIQIAWGPLWAGLTGSAPASRTSRLTRGRSPGARTWTRSPSPRPGEVEAVGRHGPPARLGPHPPRLQGRLQLHRTQRRLLPGQRPGRRPRRAAQLRERGQAAAHRGSVTIEGEVKASPAKGQATEVHASRGRAARRRRPRERTRCRRRGTRSSSCAPSPTCGRGPTRSAPSPGCATSVSKSIHDFFQEQGFLYIHTPIITASDCEGAGALFRVTHARPGQRRRRPTGKVDYTKDFFGKPAFLTVSGQLQAESFACSLGKVYTFGPTFRAENSNTPRHLAEFWMIEPEMAFYDLTDNMTLAEAFLKRIIRDALDAVRRGHEVLRRAHRQGRVHPAGERAEQPVPARAVHRGGRHPAEVGQDVRVPGRVGHRPADRSTSAS